MQDVKDLGGCPELSKQVGSSPIIVGGRETTNSFTRCPIDGTPLVWGSDDPAEDKSWYWCPQCGNGPISFPLYGGPKPVPKPRPIAEVIDADMMNDALQIVGLLKRAPVVR